MQTKPRNTTTYLAGGINGLSDADARDWREHAKTKLAGDTLDPMRRDYRGKEDQHIQDIVHGDLEDIRSSDWVLASCLRPSWGTAMEIRIAYDLGKTIYAVVLPGVPVSPWLRYHARIFTSFDLAIEAINAALGGV